MAFDPKIIVKVAAITTVILGLYLALDGDQLLGMALLVLGAGLGTAFFALRAARKL